MSDQEHQRELIIETVEAVVQAWVDTAYKTAHTVPLAAAVVSEGETHPEALSAPLQSPGGTHTNPTGSGAPRAAGAAETTQGQQP